MGKPKKNCMVFTPDAIVAKMLDIAGYTSSLYGKRILENSCGEGHILVEIVTRYIRDCRKNGYSDNQICFGLMRDIQGYEVDDDIYKTCLQNLNSVLSKHSLSEIKWNIQCKDALKEKLDSTYSFVIGNPPYIAYSALATDDREYIKKTFSVCKDGKPDYYYAFIEAAINCLDDNGRLVYLVPGNFFKTKYAEKLREYVRMVLHEIYDFKHQKVFDKELTSSVIIVCDKSIDTTKVKYYDIVNDEIIHVSKEDLIGKWIFYPISPSTETNEVCHRFGDLFSASGSVATLLNKAYLVEPYSKDYGHLEKGILRKAASPKSLANKQSKYIIFPYWYDAEGKLQKYSDDVFRGSFPHTVEHLEKHVHELQERNSDNSAKWFEYGRSQALAHINQRKLILSTLVTDKVKVYELDDVTVPYAGVYVTAKPGNNLSDAKRILESEDFRSYANKVGVHVNGKSIRISIRDIIDYRFRG